MPRVIGIDPGTVSIDVCGIENGRLFLDETLPTADALADPSPLLALLKETHRATPLHLIAGPSGYGLPLTAGRDLTETDIRLAQLSAEGETGGIGGLGSLMRQLAKSSLPVVFTPGVIHLPSVPPHRKVNRLDMGTADKVCAVALAVQERAARLGCAEHDVSFLLLELGGAFTAAIAVERGRIVDGAGGTSGALGMRGAGALDGEVAFVAGTMTKALLFGGGVLTIAGLREDTPGDVLAIAQTPRGQLAWDAYLESAMKALAALTVSAPGAREIIVSGRLAAVTGVREEIARRAATVLPGAAVYALAGFAHTTKHAAQGAALLADGLAGGRSASLVAALEIREARGTVLDHLFVIPPAAARTRLGLPR
jgi:predicted butyrate kinase (DUF1464 family)